MASKKCKLIKSHCRKLPLGRQAKAGKSCQKNNHAGHRVKGYYSPKALCRTSATVLQKFAKRVAEKKRTSAGTKRKSPTGGRTSNRAKKPPNRWITQI